MIYTTKENVQIKTCLQEECVQIKINLPLTEEDFINGNGEGVWCKCPSSFATMCENGTYAVFIVEILNDSVYYPNLKYGDRVLVTSSGPRNRPLAPLSELQFKYGPGISLEEKENIMNEIYNYHMTRIKERN